MCTGPDTHTHTQKTTHNTIGFIEQPAWWWQHLKFTTFEWKINRQYFSSRQTDHGTLFSKWEFCCSFKSMKVLMSANEMLKCNAMWCHMNEAGVSQPPQVVMSNWAPSCFKGNVGETSDRQAGAPMGFSKCTETILNWTELGTEPEDLLEKLGGRAESLRLWTADCAMAMNLTI